MKYNKVIKFKVYEANVPGNSPEEILENAEKAFNNNPKDFEEMSFMVPSDQMHLASEAVRQEQEKKVQGMVNDDILKRTMN